MCYHCFSPIYYSFEPLLLSFLSQTVLPLYLFVLLRKITPKLNIFYTRTFIVLPVMLKISNFLYEVQALSLFSFRMPLCQHHSLNTYFLTRLILYTQIYFWTLSYTNDLFEFYRNFQYPITSSPHTCLFFQFSSLWTFNIVYPVVGNVRQMKWRNI